MENIGVNVLSVNNLAKSVKDEFLFSNVSFGLDAGEHLGLIGKNGAGKSTFLRVLAGQSVPDEGECVVNSSCRLVFLEQSVSFPESCTIDDFLFLMQDEEVGLLRRYEAGDHSVAQDVENRHLWDIVTSYHRFIEELGVKKDSSELMNNLSGGEQKKVAIARVLAVNPDILLLDEPTNHLDIEAIEWLESYLHSAVFTVILVTHDRYFLDAVCSRIMEFDRHRAFFYEGGYSDFVMRRQERISALQKEQERLANILRREMEWLHRGPKARTGKDSGRKQRIEQMQNMRVSAEAESRDFSSISRRLGKKILLLDKVCASRGSVPVLKDVSFEFVKGMRIGIIGPNGSGKSTLLDVITGNLEPSSGLVDAGVNTVFGYYDQNSVNLPLNKTPVEFFSDIAENIAIDKDYVVTPPIFLELFGFPKSFHRLPIGTFSGGEKRRLYLLSQLVKNPNFLVLDEPTNDLDLDTMCRLEEYVNSFAGVVVIVSHDRAFLDRTCDELIVMPQAVRYEGCYSDWRAEKTEKAMHSKGEPVVGKVRDNQKKKGLSFKEKKEFEELEVSIEALESEKSDLESWFATGEVDIDGSKSKRYAEIGSLLDLKYERWSELSDLL